MGFTLSDRCVMDVPNIQMFPENEFSLICLKSSWSSRVILENNSDPDHEVDPPALQMPSVSCSVYSSSMGVNNKQSRSSDVLSGDVSVPPMFYPEMYLFLRCFIRRCILFLVLSTPPPWGCTASNFVPPMFYPEMYPVPPMFYPKMAPFVT